MPVILIPPGEYFFYEVIGNLCNRQPLDAAGVP